MQGRLGDGTSIHTTVSVSLNGEWSFYEALYKNRGACVGWVALSTNAGFDATMDWLKPPVATDRLYPSGFTTAAGLSGAKFLSPFAGGPPVSGSGTLTLGGGNLASDIVESVAIDTNGNLAVTSTNSAALNLTVDPATGQFSGSFLDAAIGKTIQLTGLLIRTNNFGAGFFLETNRSGFVTIQLVP